MMPPPVRPVKDVPITSIRMLRAIAEDRDSLRWNDFVRRYRPMMSSFLAQRFPTLAAESDDIVQETLLGRRKQDAVFGSVGCVPLFDADLLQ